MLEVPKGHETIFVAQDGSPAAQVAAGLAIRIAQRLNLTIHGLHVVDGRQLLETQPDRREAIGAAESATVGPELLSWYEFRGRSILDRLERRCRAAGVPVATDLLVGNVTDLILREAAQGCLLALGRRGCAHEGQPWYLGPNFRAIACHAQVPLLVGGNAQPPAKRILMICDGDGCGHDVVGWTALLQRAFSARISVLPLSNGDGRTWTPDWQAEAGVCFTREGLNAYRFVRHSVRGSGGIVTALVEEKANVVVVRNRGHDGSRERQLGETAESILSQTEVPAVLVSDSPYTLPPGGDFRHQN